MLFSQEIVGNSRTAQLQWQHVQFARAMANQQEATLAAQVHQINREMAANEGFIPRDVYQEFDNVTVERMRSDDGDTYLNDLLGLSRSINIGKLTHNYRMASDAGRAQTSMTGQIGVKMDQVEYTYDGSLIPIHDTGYSRNWREWAAHQSEGFDALIDDQRESVACLRQHLADNFLNGHRDKDGNLIVIDNISWAGVKADSRVAQVDLGAGGLNFDFTNSGNTGEQIKDAFIQLRDVLWIDNNCEMEAVYYVSREIASNFERRFSQQYDSLIIDQELTGLRGVAQIKVTNKLVGNQIMAFPLDANKIRPMVGMALNTVAMPRPLYNSNYEFVVMGAIGYEIRNDFAGRTCVMYAEG